MDGSSLIVVVMPITTLIILFTGIALPFTAASRSSRSPVRRRPPKPGAGNAAPAGFLYVPCARIRYHGYPAETHRWVQQVPIVNAYITKPVSLDLFTEAIRQVDDFFLTLVKLPAED